MDKQSMDHYSVEEICNELVLRCVNTKDLQFVSKDVLNFLAKQFDMESFARDIE